MACGFSFEKPARILTSQKKKRLLVRISLKASNQDFKLKKPTYLVEYLYFFIILNRDKTKQTNLIYFISRI